MVLATIALEILPYGAVLNFANPEGEPWRHTYSYFDLTPFGYANFGPFVAAILTCALLVLVVIGFFKYSKGLNTAIMNVSGFATAAAFLPLVFGIDYFTPIAVTIGLLLAATFGICFLKDKQ